MQDGFVRRYPASILFAIEINYNAISSTKNKSSIAVSHNTNFRSKIYNGYHTDNHKNKINKVMACVYWESKNKKSPHTFTV